MKTDAKQRATLTRMETAHAETARHLAVIERQVEARAERMTTSSRVKARQFGRASATWSRADERDVQANVAALRFARRGEIDALFERCDVLLAPSAVWVQALADVAAAVALEKGVAAPVQGTATDTAKAVAKAVKKRLAAEAKQKEAADNPDPPPPGDEEAMNGAIAGGKREQVMAAIERDSGLNAVIVKKIMTSMSAKAVTALAWKAKLSMRQALQLQLKIAGIPPHQVLNPRGGTDYPLTEREMEWQLELFTG